MSLKTWVFIETVSHSVSGGSPPVQLYVEVPV